MRNNNKNNNIYILTIEAIKIPQLYYVNKRYERIFSLEHTHIYIYIYTQPQQ